MFNEKSKFLQVYFSSMGTKGVCITSVSKCDAGKRNMINGDAANRTFVRENVSDLVDDVAKLLSLSTRLAGRVDKLKALGSYTTNRIEQTYTDCYNRLDTDKGQPCCSPNDEIADEADGRTPEMNDDGIINALCDAAAIELRNGADGGIACAGSTHRNNRIEPLGGGCKVI